MKILLIDNYDSFTYNLVHYLEAQDASVVVWRNDEIDFRKLFDYDAYVISPGPGLPKDSGDLMRFIDEVISKKPRRGRNPQTGKEIQIAASKVPGFKAGKALKDAVN